MRPGGVIAVDNTFYHGKVLEGESSTSPDALAIHKLNQKIHKDKRVDISMLPVADGLTLCRKL